MDAITLADAMELFKLPRALGLTAAGEDIVANIGRFGPYVKYGSKYVSLKEDDPYKVTLERALEVIRLKQEADANRIIADFGVDNIQVLNGRYGPYITDGKKNAKVPKDREPKSVTLEECRALLAQAPERGKGRWGRGKRRAAAPTAKPAPNAPAPARKPEAAHAAAPRHAKASAERSNGNGAKADATRRRPPSAAKKSSKKKSAPQKAPRKTSAPRPRGVK
jgi:DNA topoisomerase-1